MYTFVMIKNTRRRSLCKPLEIEFNNNFFLCKLLRAVTHYYAMANKFVIFVLSFYQKTVIENLQNRKNQYANDMQKCTDLNKINVS